MENLVGYAKRDLMVQQVPFGDLAAANAAIAAWCAEVNGTVHSEICAVPAERLIIERELLGPLLGAGSVHRDRGGVRTDDGRLLVIMAGTGPRTVKRARHNSYRVKRAGDQGTRHAGPLTIKLVDLRV